VPGFGGPPKGSPKPVREVQTQRPAFSAICPGRASRPVGTGAPARSRCRNAAPSWCSCDWSRDRRKFTHKGPGRFAMYRVIGAVAVVVGLTTYVVAQVPTPPFFSPAPPCPSATSPFDTRPAEARWDYVCPQNVMCGFQFWGITGPNIGSVLAASIFVLNAGPQNRAFAASVTNTDGTTLYYTENPLEFKWSVVNMTLQCRSQ